MLDTVGELLQAKDWDVPMVNGNVRQTLLAEAADGIIRLRVELKHKEADQCQ